MSFESGAKQHKKPSASSPRSHRILVIDDDLDNLNIILEPLSWEGYDVRGTTSVDMSLQWLESWIPHVVILDRTIPSMNSLQLLQHIREKAPHISCMFVSNNQNTEVIIESLDAGADDYIVKPFVPLEFLARVRTQIRIRNLHEQFIVANQQLKELVDIDDLTGLYNMRSFYQRVEFEMERAKRYNREVAVVMMDMDYFKTANDGHDHLFGSYVLAEVGKIIKANTRNIDIPARYGGDEFLVVLSETNHAGVMNFCERLRQTISATTFVNGKDSINLTISLGFAIHVRGEDIAARELVRRADEALYDAKRGGRNQVRFYEPAIAQVYDINKNLKNRHKKATG